MAPMNSPNKSRILVLGGGFAGIGAVLKLEELFSSVDQVNIALISRENFFLFTPMLAEVAMGAVDARHIVNPIRELCRKAEFHRGEVIGISLKNRTVDILYNNMAACPGTLSYDHLVLALGSSTNVMLIPGVDKYAFHFKEIADALLIRNHILEMFERADMVDDPLRKRGMLTFCVIGGGYSGVEVAAAIRDMAVRIEPLYPTIRPEDIRVLLIEAQNRILTTLPPDLSEYAQKQLGEMGVEVKLNTRLMQVHPRWIELEGGVQISTYTTVWATGIIPSPVVSGMDGISKDSKGRPLGTSELRLAGFDNVWAIGDNALTPYFYKAGFYPATAQVAIRQGHHLAENLNRAIHGEPLQPFCYDQKGEMVVLGERSAVALVLGRKIKGFPAWVLWRLFYLSRLPRWKKKARVAVDWLLSLFGPMETTQLKLYFRQEPCDIEDTECQRENIPEQRRAGF